MFWIYLSNLLVSTFLLGLIAFVQIVHYPIFSRISSSDFKDFHAFHTIATGKLVILPMLLELILSFAWILLPTTENDWHWRGLALVLVLGIWTMTFFLFVPLHSQLAQGFDADIVRRLVLTNGWRTLLWALRFAIAFYLFIKVYGKSI